MLRDIFKHVFGSAGPESAQPNRSSGNLDLLGADPKPENPSPELLARILGSAFIVNSILKNRGAEASLPSHEPMAQNHQAADQAGGTVVYLNQRRRLPSKTHAQQGIDDDTGPTAA